MNQLRALYQTLSRLQRISICIAVVAIGAGLFALAHWQKERSFEPLYRELGTEDAGALVTKLKEKGVDYRLADNGTTVLVPSTRSAELRLEMAAAGLPRSGRPGFELFDKVNFGITDFAEQVNFRRALEGELERSVMALAEVDKARVHLTFKKDSVYLDARQPAKASVLVKLRPGSHLTPVNVQAVTHLIASAVEGLSPESVSVLDMQGNLLSRARKGLPGDSNEANEATLEYRAKIERELLTKIESTLEPLLGADRFRAGVSVECDFSSAEESQEVFDPNASVMSSSQKSEDATASTSVAGVPGTASSLPRPTSTPSRAPGGISRRTESIAYQTSRTVRHKKVPQGEIRKISASVLLDQELQWQGEGSAIRRVLIPPPPERLKAIRDLVAATIGFSEPRGDQIIVEALPFEMTLKSEPPAAPPAATSKPPDVSKKPWAGLIGEPGAMAPRIGASLAVLVVIGVGFWHYRKYILRKPRAGEPPTAADQKTLPPVPISAALPPASGAATAPQLDTRSQIRERVLQDPQRGAVILKHWITEGKA